MTTPMPCFLGERKCLLLLLTFILSSFANQRYSDLMADDAQEDQRLSKVKCVLCPKGNAAFFFCNEATCERHGSQPYYCADFCDENHNHKGSWIPIKRARAQVLNEFRELI